ncbi:unnamed protein product [Gordionus sp. m RMFG-2023]
MNSNIQLTENLTKRNNKILQFLHQDFKFNEASDSLIQKKNRIDYYYNQFVINPVTSLNNSVSLLESIITIHLLQLEQMIYPKSGITITKGLINIQNQLINEYNVFISQYSTNFKNIQNVGRLSLSNKWKALADELVNNHEIIPDQMPQLGEILYYMRNEDIKEASNILDGTQLKILLTLKSNAKLIMKPQRYYRNKEFLGYQGADRHNGEIVAFYINRLLGFNKVPLTTGRLINITELKAKSNIQLSHTFYRKHSDICFYGVCYYCNKNESVCIKAHSNLEASISLFLPSHAKLTKYVNPWIRSYKHNYLARWEYDPQFCRLVRQNSHPLNIFNKLPNLLDLIDSCILDFLIGNSDRHHVEFLSINQPSISSNLNKIFMTLLDNGKSFGTYKHDEFSILAPLYNCCILRLKTWRRLIQLASFSLININSTQSQVSDNISLNSERYSFSMLLRTILNSEDIPNLLHPQYYIAINRRLNIIISLVNHCLINNENLEHKYKYMFIADE